MILAECIPVIGVKNVYGKEREKLLDVLLLEGHSYHTWMKNE